MASAGNSLNEDKLKPGLEALAAKILRQDKNIKKVEIKAKLETKTTRQGASQPEGEQAGVEKPASAKSAAGRPKAKDEAGKGAEGDSGKSEEQPGQESNKGEQDKEQPEGKGPGEAAGQEAKDEEAGKAGGEKDDGEGQKEGEEEGSDEADKEAREQGDEKKDPSIGSEQADKADEEAGGEADGEKPVEAGGEDDGGKGQKEGEEEGGEEKDSGKKPGQEGNKESGEEAGEQAEKQGDLDSRILNPEEEGKAARELREKKSSSAKAKEDESAEAEAGTGGETEPQSLRQRVQAARQALNLKEQAKKKLEEKVVAPAKQALSQILKQAWLNLIDSFGLTLIWINIHVFLKWVLGEKLFCKLGEEWLPKQVTQAGGEAAETAGKGIGLIEVMVLLILDLIVLAVILGALALIVMIVNFMGKSWWGKLTDLWDAFWGLGWGGISALVDLFGK